jgi:hypothetical protein
LWLVVAFAVAFRLTQLGANPIQEIDIYRYLWDGQAAWAGVNPWAYSPAQVERGDVPAEVASRLRGVLAGRAVASIFRTVDHREVATVYPPLSQAVFALAAGLTPADFDVRGHVVVLKALFLVFDLGVIVVLVLLLRALGKPAAWSLAYAWCPLVIKEVANSGHVDVVAVFFTVLTAWLFVRGRPYWGSAAWSAAVLAKLYPVILLPLVVRGVWERGGWRGTVGPLALAGALLGGTYLAVWPRPAGTPEPGSSPVKGLQVFLAEWEMNDPIFHTTFAGLDRALGEERQRRWVEACQPWWPHRVATAPEADRVAVAPAFVLTLAVMGVVLCGVVGRLALRRWPAGESPWGEGVFAALAAAFLLSPTANPWYFVWAVPFLPWARLRAWFLLPGLVLQYYLRFWFAYHYDGPESSVAGTGLDGLDFFDQVWVWVEYGPFFVLCGVEAWRRRT